MRADIHPEYHEITVVMTDGTEYKTRSTYGKEGDMLKLDVDPLTHPAWQGGTGKVIEKGQLDKFEGKYGSFLSGAAGEKAPAKEANKPDLSSEASAQEEETAEAAPAEAPVEDAAPAAEETATTEEESKQ